MNDQKRYESMAKAAPRPNMKSPEQLMRSLSAALKDIESLPITELAVRNDGVMEYVKDREGRIRELESQMQGLSNEINDFQNIIERLKREIHELQCKQDTPLAFYEISHDEDGEVEYLFSVYPRPGYRPLYKQAFAKEQK